MEMQCIFREVASEVLKNLLFRKFSVFTENSKKQKRKMISFRPIYTAELKKAMLVVPLCFRSLVDPYVIYLFILLLFKIQSLRSYINRVE
jgi:hypothetical protein